MTRRVNNCYPTRKREKGINRRNESKNFIIEMNVPFVPSHVSIAVYCQASLVLFSEIETTQKLYFSL